MNDEIVKTIVELVRDGGQAACWIYAIHCLTTLLRVILIGGTLITCVSIIAKLIKYAIKKHVVELSYAIQGQLEKINKRLPPLQ